MTCLTGSAWQSLYQTHWIHEAIFSTCSLGDLPGLGERVPERHQAVLLPADQAGLPGPEDEVQLLRAQQSVHPGLQLWEK